MRKVHKYRIKKSMKMKEMLKLKDFDTFVQGLNENHTKKQNAIASAVDKIKERYGENAKDFIAAVQNTGIDKVKDFIVHSVKPEIDFTQTPDLKPDYDGILTGLVSWVVLELQLEKNK